MPERAQTLRVGKVSLVLFCFFFSFFSPFLFLLDAEAYFKRIYGVCWPGFSDWDVLARRLCGPDFRLKYDPAISSFGRDPCMSPAHLWPALALLAEAGPVLVVRGELSDILAAETAAKMARVEGVRLVQVAGVGHTPMLTEQEAAGAMISFLKSLKK